MSIKQATSILSYYLTSILFPLVSKTSTLTLERYYIPGSIFPNTGAIVAVSTSLLVQINALRHLLRRMVKTCMRVNIQRKVFNIHIGVCHVNVGDYLITYFVPLPLPSVFTTPFLPISFSNCVVFDLPNGA